jgi:hypothetical protein
LQQQHSTGASNGETRALLVAQRGHRSRIRVLEWPYVKFVCGAITFFWWGGAVHLSLQL